jgi:Divergent InlB B-repeat domain
MQNLFRTLSFGTSSRGRSFFQRLKLVSVAGGGLLLTGLCASAQAYHSNDLTPPGSSSGRLNGTSGRRQVGGAQTPSGSHAVLLSGNALSAVDLHPAGYYYSMAMCSDETQEGGWGNSYAGGIHALLWSGSSSSYVDLNPSGYSFSYCLGVHNGQQVGYAQNQSYFVTASHAMLWYGSAASAVDLHAGTYPYSRAMGCHDGEQVGYVSSLAYPDGDASGYHTTSHAMRWSGSAASAVDLHPLGYDASEALCTSGTQQGGWGYLALGTTHLHALLWSGDAGSVVDLHPAAYSDSKITALTATQQVGEGWIGPANGYGSIRHALLWSGTPESVVDLNQYLPAGYTNAVATGIDVDGNVVGYAYNSYASGLSIPYDAVAVVFAPGVAPAAGLAGLTLTPANVAPGTDVQVQVSLGGPAPTGGANISFLSTATNLVATPAPIAIPEGETSVVISLPTGGNSLTIPTSLKLYATDGSVSRASTLTLTPVVNIASFTANPVEGGFSTWGSVSLNIPAQAGGAVVNLSSGDPTLVGIASSVMIPQGYNSMSFNINTAPVTVLTSVPVTATFNGQSVTGSVSLSPAPVISLAGLSFPMVVGGQNLTGTVTLNNFPRSAAGAVVTLTSGDPNTLQVPATVTVPQGAYSISIPATTTVVNGLKGVSVKATYNGSTFTTTVLVNPIPTVTITQADYLTDTHMFKVTATTTYTNSILTYGTDPTSAPIGTMQFEQGVFKGSIIMDTAPSFATVWNSNGGQASMAVALKTSSVGGGGGGGGGAAGGSTSVSYKPAIATTGKGTVTTSPSGTSFAAGTVVTLTATPAAGSPWIGWSGDASGTSRTVTVTMTRDMKVTANFK